MFKKYLPSIIIATIISAAISLHSQNTYPWGQTLPSTCTVGTFYFLVGSDSETLLGLKYCSSTNVWSDLPTSSSGIPSGSILLINTGTCPSGFAEVSALNGKTLFGTIASNGDVGTTGGSDTITPTVNSLTAAAQTFTGTPFSSVINHTHTLTTTSTSRLQGGTTASTTGTHIMTSTATGGSARAPTAGDLFTGTTDNPSGGVSSITPAGTNGTSVVTGTLNSFDNRSAFMRVIFCQKS